MMSKQVIAECRKRFGRNGNAQQMKNGQKMVGHIAMGCMFMVEGSGKTWEEAFAAADAKKTKQEAK